MREDTKRAKKYVSDNMEADTKQYISVNKDNPQMKKLYEGFLKDTGEVRSEKGWDMFLTTMAKNYLTSGSRLKWLKNKQKDKN